MLQTKTARQNNLPKVTTVFTLGSRDRLLAPKPMLLILVLFMFIPLLGKVQITGYMGEEEKQESRLLGSKAPGLIMISSSAISKKWKFVF